MEEKWVTLCKSGWILISQSAACLIRDAKNVPFYSLAPRILPLRKYTLSDAIKARQLLCDNSISNGHAEMSLQWLINFRACKCLHLSSGRATHLEIDIWKKKISVKIENGLQSCSKQRLDQCVYCSSSTVVLLMADGRVIFGHRI